MIDRCESPYEDPDSAVTTTVNDATEILHTLSEMVVKKGGALFFTKNVEVYSILKSTLKYCQQVSARALSFLQAHGETEEDMEDEDNDQEDGTHQVLLTSYPNGFD
jgi:hypothetical protein